MFIFSQILLHVERGERSLALGQGISAAIVSSIVLDGLADCS
jgi:hypothetical protein